MLASSNPRKSRRLSSVSRFVAKSHQRSSQAAGHAAAKASVSTDRVVAFSTAPSASTVTFSQSIMVEGNPPGERSNISISSLGGVTPYYIGALQENILALRLLYTVTSTSCKIYPAPAPLSLSHHGKVRTDVFAPHSRPQYRSLAALSLYFCGSIVPPSKRAFSARFPRLTSSVRSGRRFCSPSSALRLFKCEVRAGAQRLTRCSSLRSAR